jgi:DMSO reductase anchor subunit
MHPAYSVIVFTTASGAGYGLLALLGALSLFGLVPEDRWVALAAFALAFAGIAFGLASSTAHLGHPERAWRAFSQWRSSWLSREAVWAAGGAVPAGLFAIGWVFLGTYSGTWRWFAAATVVCAIMTVHATGMIYSTLKPIAAWNNRWVVPNYLALALATGALLLDALAAAFSFLSPYFAFLAAALLALALWLKWHYWRHIDASPGPATPETATGLAGLGPVRLLETPSTQENFVQREMGYRIARTHASRLRVLALALLYELPILLTLAATFTEGMPAIVLTFAAVLSAAPGVLIERWLFFAEAKHAVTLYYGAARA